MSTNIDNLPLNAIVLVNSNNPTQPGGTTIKGGNIPLTDIGDPVAQTDAVNLKTLELYSRLSGEPRFYVSAPTDFGPLTTITGVGDYYLISVDGIYVVMNALELLHGVSFAPGVKVAIISINSINSLANFENVTSAPSTAAVSLLFPSNFGNGPIFYADNDHYPSYFSMQNIAFTDLSSFIPNNLFALGNASFTQRMVITLDNIFTGFPRQEVGNLGFIDGGTGDSLVKISNSNLGYGQNGLQFLNLKELLFTNNVGGPLGSASGPMMEIGGANTGHHLYSNNFIRDDSSNAPPFFKIDTTIGTNAKINIIGHNGGEANTYTFFDNTGLNDLDSRITCRGCFRKQDSFYGANVLDLTNTVYNQSLAQAAVPQIIETSSAGNNWVIDNFSLSRFNITVGPIAAAQISNGSPAVLETAIIEYIGDHDIILPVSFYASILPPQNATGGIGFFRWNGLQYVPLSNSYRVHVMQNMTADYVTTAMISFSPGTRIVGGIQSSGNLGASYGLSNPHFIIFSR